MLRVDTNVLLRFVLDDDHKQALVAKDVIGNNDVRVSTTVLLEAEWVLRSGARLERHRVHAILTDFVRLPNVSLDSPDRVRLALEWFAQGMDFADALHLAGCEAGDEFATFDRKLVASARKAKAGKVKAL